MVFMLPLLVVLPFAALLRVSTYGYQHHGLPTWLAVGGGCLAALVSITAYGVWISLRLSGKARVSLIVRWIAAPLVVIYVGHALFFLSSVNAKTERVRAYYTSVHPLLRVAVSTLVIVDGSVVITDLGREPSDYESMGLPVADWSLHFRQRDGYVHALDLRTIDRGAVRNWLTAAYFRILGFRTLRHVGTADHLHVSLALPPAGGMLAGL
jgi:hypothetical protein